LGRDPWQRLRRLQPVDARFGMGRGTPVDRIYIERFLDRHKSLIQGDVVEVGDDRYTRAYGDPRTRSFVLDRHARSGVSIVGDLEAGLPEYEGAFDCLLLTQVLPFVFDVDAAVATTRSLCKAGGSVLATFPGISQISRYDMKRSGDFWRFTDASASRLFANAFGEENVRVESFGNLLTATALLHGIAAEELDATEVDYHDPDYPVIVAVVARALDVRLQTG
jgi:hypothetical protein